MHQKGALGVARPWHFFGPRSYTTIKGVANTVLPHEEENGLVDQARQGDRTAFAALVRAYTTPLYNISLRLTGRRSEAEDLVQESFLRAFKALGEFQAGRRFSSWLYAICLNAVRDHLRRRERAPDRGRSAAPPVGADPSFADPPDPNLPTPEEAWGRQEERAALLLAVQQLPLPLREALVLRYFQELPFSEVALACKITENAAKKRVYQALTQLQTALATPGTPGNKD